MHIATSIAIGLGGLSICVALSYVLDKVGEICFALKGETGALAEGENRG